MHRNSKGTRIRPSCRALKCIQIWIVALVYDVESNSSSAIPASTLSIHATSPLGNGSYCFGVRVSENVDAESCMGFVGMYKCENLCYVVDIGRWDIANL